MSINLTYIASSGNSYNLKGDGLRSKSANYHTWNWIPNGTQLQFGKRLANFSRDAAVYETRLIMDKSIESRKTLVDNLHEDFERDVRFQTPGRIVWGDWYIECYITASSTFPDPNQWWTDNDITLWCPRPFWVKERTRSFEPIAGGGPSSPIVGTGQAGYMTLGGGAQTFLDYSFDFSYDFYRDLSGGETWARDFPFESDFRMVIYGEVANPRVVINNHVYQVNDTVGAGEYIIIDSRTNTLIKNDGTQDINIFDFRDKTSSVFQKLPGGSLNINWSGLFGFDLTVYEERSEPRWS